MLRTAAAVAFALATSCGGGGLSAPTVTTSPLTAPLRAETPRPGAVDMEVNARLKLQASGAHTASVDQIARLHVVEYLRGRNTPVTWFLSVSTAPTVKLPDGRIIQFTADLSPGLYEGPGTYTMSGDSKVSVGGKSGLGSAAYLLIGKPGAAAPPEKFDRFGKPCTLVVSERAASGIVDCPSLLDGQGKSVTLRWSWERV